MRQQGLKNKESSRHMAGLAHSDSTVRLSLHSMRRHMNADAAQKKIAKNSPTQMGQSVGLCIYCSGIDPLLCLSSMAYYTWTLHGFL